MLFRLHPKIRTHPDPVAIRLWTIPGDLGIDQPLI
jgi:hypothetical protein